MNGVMILLYYVMWMYWFHGTCRVVLTCIHCYMSCRNFPIQTQSKHKCNLNYYLFKFDTGLFCSIVFIVHCVVAWMNVCLCVCLCSFALCPLAVLAFAPFVWLAVIWILDARAFCFVLTLSFCGRICRSIKANCPGVKFVWFVLQGNFWGRERLSMWSFPADNPEVCVWTWFT